MHYYWLWFTIQPKFRNKQNEIHHFYSKNKSTPNENHLLHSIQVQYIKGLRSLAQKEIKQNPLVTSKERNRATHFKYSNGLRLKFREKYKMKFDTLQGTCPKRKKHGTSFTSLLQIKVVAHLPHWQALVCLTCVLPVEANCGISPGCYNFVQHRVWIREQTVVRSSYNKHIKPRHALQEMYFWAHQSKDKMMTNVWQSSMHECRQYIHVERK